MSEFTKGMLIWAAIIVTGTAVIYMISHATVYVDNLHTQRISQCEANGYTWGECWNVIVGNKEAFTK